MAVDMFLKLDTVDGESTDSVHEGEIDILSWSFAAHQTGTSNTGGGSGAGRVSIQDLTVTKKTDKSLADAVFALLQRRNRVKTAHITVRKAGGDALEYLIVSMGDILADGLPDHGQRRAGPAGRAGHAQFQACRAHLRAPAQRRHRRPGHRQGLGRQHQQGVDARAPMIASEMAGLPLL